MIDTRHLPSSSVRNDLTNALRQVRAAHDRIGAPELPGLKTAWLQLDRALSMASVSGDDRSARAAVERYRERGLAAVKEATR